MIDISNVLCYNSQNSVYCAIKQPKFPERIKTFGFVRYGKSLFYKDNKFK